MLLYIKRMSCVIQECSTVFTQKCSEVFAQNLQKAVPEVDSFDQLCFLDLLGMGSCTKMYTFWTTEIILYSALCNGRNTEILQKCIGDLK